MKDMDKDKWRKFGHLNLKIGVIYLIPEDKGILLILTIEWPFREFFILKHPWRLYLRDILKKDSIVRIQMNRRKKEQTKKKAKLVPCNCIRQRENKRKEQTKEGNEVGLDCSSLAKQREAIT